MQDNSLINRINFNEIKTSDYFAELKNPSDHNLCDEFTKNYALSKDVLY